MMASYGTTPIPFPVVLGKQGRPKKDEEKGSNPIFKKRGRDYDLARLRRDRPDLAAEVDAGDMSANAQIRELIKRRKSCPWATSDARNLPELERYGCAPYGTAHIDGDADAAG